MDFDFQNINVFAQAEDRFLQDSIQALPYGIGLVYPRLEDLIIFFCNQVCQGHPFT